MEIGKETITNLANQIYLNLTEDDIDKLLEEIRNIVEEIKILDGLDVSNIKRDVSVLNYSNVFRKDEVKEFKEKELLFQNTTEVYNDMFKIPKILN